MTDNGLRAAGCPNDHPGDCVMWADGWHSIGRGVPSCAFNVVVMNALRATHSLDDAWRKAEERLPHLGDRRKSWRLVLTSNGKGTYGAEALPPLMPYHDWMDAKVEAYEDSPAAALLALAERLTEEAPDAR